MNNKLSLHGGVIFKQKICKLKKVKKLDHQLTAKNKKGDKTWLEVSTGSGDTQDMLAQLVDYLASRTDDSDITV